MFAIISYILAMMTSKCLKFGILMKGYWNPSLILRMLNFLQIDFPSPSYRSSWSSDTSQSSDFVSYGKNFAPAESTKSTNTEIDEPIFWPFAHKFASNLNHSRNFLIMSPPKIMSKFLLQNSETDIRGRRKLSLNSTLQSTKILEKKHGKGDNHVKLINNAPNLSTKSIRSFSKDDIMEFKHEEYLTVEEIVDLDEHLKSMEEDFEVVQELSIEKLLGHMKGLSLGSTKILLSLMNHSKKYCCRKFCEFLLL
ncbi:uncharacterized protein LOC113753742 isoform X1 [Coffea eugenioides]|uniref:uncharacterized protein LOC113753742 isoform X1 n=1 Tax=Coffea eugenioides TaxID=49369 RepID=UPI000F60F29F|nr:uncharacterized protein LOC113753742 isoform X1 [Coffea eugenioides]